MELQNFSVIRGDGEEVTFDIVDGSGVDIKLSGIEIEWKVFAQETGVVVDDATPLFTKSISHGIEIIESPESFKVTIEGADTEDLLGNYYHEAKVIDGLGIKTTVTQGIMTVLEAQ